MAYSEFETDITARIWSKSGYYWEVGPDADGLSIEIRYFNSENDKKPVDTVMFELGAANHIVKAIQTVLKNMEDNA